MSEVSKETAKSDDTSPEEVLDTRKAVSAYLDAFDASLETDLELENSVESEDEISVNESEVKQIAARVGGLSKAMRIVAYNAYHDSTSTQSADSKRESFELFSGEVYRLAQECDRAVREFDSVINNAVKAIHSDKPRKTPSPTSNEANESNVA